VAQAFAFLAAGFETSATTMSFALYELALQPDIQDRLRTEITKVLSKHQGQLTYDGMQEMVYLDMVVSGEAFDVGYTFFLEPLKLEESFPVVTLQRLLDVSVSRPENMS